MGAVDKSIDLQVWLSMLQKFSKKTLSKETIENIYNHVGHYWKNDRLAGIDMEDKYFSLMPVDL